MLYGLKKKDRIFTVTKSYLHHEMDRGAKAAGVKRIRIHDLRHSHISLLIDMGFSAVAIADRVGHESIEITYQYAHLFPSKQTEMAERLDEEIMHSISGDISLYAGKLDQAQTQYIVSTVKGVAVHREELDAQIEANARGWTLARLSRITIAVLRLAIYEMHYVQDVPIGVAINEAVELAKTYDSDEAASFINGVLGAIARTMETSAT